MDAIQPPPNGVTTNLIPNPNPAPTSSPTPSLSLSSTHASSSSSPSLNHNLISVAVQTEDCPQLTPLVDLITEFKSNPMPNQPEANVTNGHPVVVNGNAISTPKAAPTVVEAHAKTEAKTGSKSKTEAESKSTGGIVEKPKPKVEVEVPKAPRDDIRATVKRSSVSASPVLRGNQGMRQRRQNRPPPKKIDKLPAKALDRLVGKNARLIGKYEVVKELGRGAQGVVYKCRDIKSNTFVAIKSMPATGGIGRRWNRKSPAVSREVALLKKISHPNLVSLIEVMNDEENKMSHVVIEYVDGGPPEDLSDELLLNGIGTPLREDDSRNYFRQLLSALRYLHYHHILHRDIKPSNLLMDTKTGLLKLTDFGIAITSTDEKSHRVLGSDDNILAYANVSGTPAFLPPEYYKLLRTDYQSEGDMEDTKQRSRRTRRLSHKLSKLSFGLSAKKLNAPESANSLDSASNLSVLSETTEEEEQTEWQAPVLQYFNGRPADIWAAGVTLYAFTYGKLPFAPVIKKGVKATPHENLVSLQDQIVTSTLRFPGTGLGVSSKLKHLLSRMLEKNPLKRIQMHEILIDPWVCYLEPMPPLSGEQKSSLEPTTKEVNAVVGEMKRLTRLARAEAHRLGAKARNSLAANRVSSQDSDED